MFTNEYCNQVSRGKQVPVILCWCTNLVIAGLLIASVAHLRADDRRVLSMDGMVNIRRKSDDYFPELDSLAAVVGTVCLYCLTLNIPRRVLRGLLLVCYWLTSVEINKHEIFDPNNA